MDDLIRPDAGGKQGDGDERCRDGSSSQAVGPCRVPALHRRRRPLGTRDPRQLVTQVGGALPSCLGILCKALCGDPIEGRRLGHDGRHGRGIALENRRDHLRICRALKGAPAGDHLVEHTAERPDVRALIDGTPGQLLGRHVWHRADRDTRAGRTQRLRDSIGTLTHRGLGQPEVEQLRARPGQHDVARFEIPVDQPGAVRRREPVGDLDGDAQRFLDRQAAPDHPRRERFALQVLHDEQRAVAVPRKLEERADAGVAERGERPRLTLEPSLRIRVAEGAGRQDLDRHGAADARVRRLVHLSHAARTDGLDDLVSVETSSGAQHRMVIELSHRRLMCGRSG